MENTAKWPGPERVSKVQIVLDDFLFSDGGRGGDPSWNLARGSQNMIK